MEDVTIDKISIDVSANTSDAESNLKRLEQLVSNLKGLQKTADNASKNIQRATRKSATKQPSVEQNAPVAPVKKTVNSEPPELKETNQQLEETKNTADEASSSLTRLQKFLGALSSSAGSMKAGFLSAVPVVKKFGSTMLNVATMPIRKYFHGITSGFTKLVDGIRHKITLIKRMVMLKLFRLAFQGIIDGIKEANDNLYKYSQSIDSTLYKSRDKIYSASKYASNSLAAMTAPLINALAPAIDFVIGKMVELMNMFNQFVASLTGADTWTRAIKQQLSYGDSLDKSDKKANKLKRTLMGFDELNLLNGNNDTSSDDMAYKGMFEEVKVDSNNGLSNFVDSLKQKVQEQDWYGLGQLLAEKFNSAFENVNTEQVGVKLGNKINALIDTANGFLENAHFVDLGKKLSDFVNGSITTINWDNAGRLFANGFTSILDIAIGFLSNLKVDKVIDALIGFVSGALTKLGEWLRKTDWKKLIDNLQKGVKKGLNEQNATKLAGGITSAVTGVLEIVGDYIETADITGVLGAVTTFIGNVFANIGWEDIVYRELSVALGSIPKAIARLVTGGGIMKEKFLAGLFKAFGADSAAGYAEGVAENREVEQGKILGVFDKWIAAIKSMLKISSPSKVFEEMGSFTIQGFINGVQSKVEAAKTVFSTFIDGIKNKFSQSNTDIETNTKTKWDNIKNTIKSALDTIKNWFSGLKLQLPHIKLPHFKLEGSFSLDPPSVPKIGIDWYAKGGFPNEGQLFVAREAGAEMVGSIGGRTAVANNQDIVTAVSKGVYSAVKDAMSGNGNAPVTVNLVVDGEVFYETIVSRNRNETYRTGTNPLLA